MTDDGVTLLQGLATTRAIRRFTAAPVSDADLATVFFGATRAPSGSNRQPFRFVVLRDGDLASRAKAMLGTCFRAAWASKQRAERYGEGSGTQADSPKSRVASAMQHFVDHFEEIPVVVLVCALPYLTEQALGPRQLDIIERAGPDLILGGSVFPACQNLLLAARAIGLGGVMTGWHFAIEDDLRELLGMPPDVRIVCTIPLGHPQGSHGPVRRRPISELVYDGAWAEPADWAVDPPGTRFSSAWP